ENIIEEVINKLSINHDVSMDEVREILENEDILVNLINFINRASELINNYVNLKYNGNEENNYNNVNDIIQSSNLEPIETITIPTTTLDNIINISDTSSINDNDNLNLDLDEN
ncbi:8632_t:CDS:2, partial [Entrophospora sp. SA101]